MLFWGKIHRFGHSSYSMEYFINTHNTYCKELSFNFPEHQKILKSIKNPMRKSKKYEIFLKILTFFKKSKNFENFENPEF